jgi:ligand-binding sensor domain-containing protein
VGVAAAIAGSLLALLGRAEAVAADDGAPHAAPPAELRWRPVAVEVADDVVGALALDRAGRLAVGDARGVAFGFPGSPMRRVALRGEVRDLAFFGDEFDAETEREPALLSATPLGLYRIASDGRVESVAPGPGPDANAVARIAVAGRVVAVATAAGAFASLDGMRWQRLSEELPSGPATALALAAREGFAECWVAIRGELWHSELRAEAGRAASTTPVRVAIPFASGQRPPIDIALDVGDAAAAIVFDAELVVRWKADARWEQLRPALPPGASALRLVAALERYWLATDRGLLVAPSLRGPWSRAHASSGSDAIFDLEAGEGALYAGTDNGLAVARFAPDFAIAAEAAQLPRDFSLAAEVPSSTRPESPRCAAVSRGADGFRSSRFAPAATAITAATPTTTKPSSRARCVT